MNGWDHLSDDEEVNEIYACLLREKCIFDEEKHSIKTSMHFCFNFRKRQRMNKIWGPCLETATIMRVYAGFVKTLILWVESEVGARSK